MEQPQIHRRALGQLIKVLLGGGGVAVGLPASAAGKALAPVPDNALARPLPSVGKMELTADTRKQSSNSRSRTSTATG